MSKPTSSPAMTNTADLHLLPRIGHQNDTRRTSSPGGCCCFGTAFPRIGLPLIRQLQSQLQAIIPALMSKNPIHIIGGGLAGSEAAWQAAQAGVPVVLHEMRPRARHRCAQDRRSGRARLLQFLPLRRCRDQRRRPAARRNAAGRLADHGARRRATRCRPAARLPSTATAFRDAVTAQARSPSADHHRARGGRRPAAGGLGPGDHRHRPADRARRLPRRSPTQTGADALAFFDAIAPIVHFDTIDMDICWFQSRYDKVGPGGTGKDYINCPMDKDAVRGLRRRR